MSIPPPYLQTLRDNRIDETNYTNKTILEDYFKNQTPVTIQRKYLERTAGDHNLDMDYILTGTITKYLDEYGFLINGKNVYQFIYPTHYDKVIPVLNGGYKRRVRKSKRANKRTHKKQRTNRRKR